MTTPEEMRTAWNARKESREAMIRLGGMLHDLECYVDNCLKFNESSEVVGRNGGIKGWLSEKLPELLPKYKTLMRYKAMAVRLRQVTDTRDPKPTAALLDETPRHDAVAAILAALSAPPILACPGPSAPGRAEPKSRARGGRVTPSGPCRRPRRRCRSSP